jgi:hypothetical protein
LFFFSIINFARTDLLDLAKTVENCNQIKTGLERIQKHGARFIYSTMLYLFLEFFSNFVITDEFTEKIKEICEKASAANALMPNSVKIQRNFFKYL